MYPLTTGVTGVCCERRRSMLAGGFPRVLFPPLWCFPPAVSGWGSVWVGLTPRDDLASTGFHDCHQRTVRQPRPTRPRLATGARPSVPHHHPIRPRRARTTSRPTSVYAGFTMERSRKGPMPERKAWCQHRHVGGGTQGPDVRQGTQTGRDWGSYCTNTGE